MRKQRKRQIAGIMAAIFMLSGINTSAFADIMAEMPENNIERTWQEAAESPSDAKQEIIKRVTADNAEQMIVKRAIPGNAEQTIAEKATPNNAVMFAAEGEVLGNDVIEIVKDGSALTLTMTDNSCSGEGYVIQQLNEGEYQLSLSDFTGDTLDIKQGTWEIILSGTNTVKMKTQDPSGAFEISGEGTEVTLKGEGKLAADGYRYGIFMDKNSTVKVESGEVETFSSESSYAVGIMIDHSSSLEVSGGKITGNGGRGVMAYNEGKIEITGGELIANGRGNGIELGIGTKITVRDGKLTADGLGSGKSGISAEYKNIEIRIEENGRVEATGSKGLQLGGGNGGNGCTLVIEGEGAYLNTRLWILYGNELTLQDGGTFEAGYVHNSGKIYLKEGGKLKLNGKYQSGGRGSALYDRGGEISGEGTFASDSKIAVNAYSRKPEGANVVLNSSVPLEEFFSFSTDGFIEKIGNITYSVDNEGIENPGSAEVDNEKKTVRFTGIGKVRLRVDVEETKYYSGATRTQLLEVCPIFLDNKVTVTAYTGTYDGTAHPAVEVKVDGEDSEDLDIKVEYAEDTETGSRNYATECPMVTEVSDSGKTYWVRLTGASYKECVIKSGPVTIDRCPADTQNNWSVELKGTEFEYDGERHEPEITVKLGEQVMEEGIDYTWVSYYRREAQGDKERTPINAGTYYVKIWMNKNYTGYVESSIYHAEGTDGTFVIHPHKLTAKLRILQAIYHKKTYDGTTWVPDSRMLNVDLYDGDEKMEDRFLYVNTNNAVFQYSDPNVGENKKILATGLTLSGGSAENYIIDGTAETEGGTILPAYLASCEVKADDLYYNGEPQKANVHIKVLGINSEEITDPTITYSTIRNGEYTEEIPAFTSPAQFGVYYKIEVPNYRSATGNFSVTIHKADLNEALVRLREPEQVYAAKNLDPGVEVVYKGHVLPEDSYHVSFKETDFNGNGQAQIGEVQNTGTYVVEVTGDVYHTTGKKEAEQRFRISPKPLSDGIQVTFDPEKMVYDGAEHYPGVTVRDSENETDLTEDIDYKADYQGEWRDAAEYILKLTGAAEYGQGNYCGFLEVPYSIEKEDLSKAVVVVRGSYQYDATEKRPEADQIEVTLNGKTVAPGEFEISYQNNINTGKNAKVIITAKAAGNYKNQAEGTFEIEPAVLKISGAEIKTKIYDGKKDGTVTALSFKGLKGADQLRMEKMDYGAEAEFSDANAGEDRTVQIIGRLGNTDIAKNYVLEENEFTLEGQTIKKASAPELEIQHISMPYDIKGEQQIELAILPEDCGTVYDAKASIIPKQADMQIVDSVRMDGTTVILTLRDSRRWMIGEMAVIAVDGIRTTNYEDMSGKIELVLTDRAYQESSDSDDGDSGNQSKNVSSSVKNPKGWLLDGNGWRFRFPNGTYANGSIIGTDNSGNRLVKYHWEMVNDRWYAFDENGYLKTGMFYDAGYNGMFYVDENLRMHTGWKLINGKWYYFNVVSDGTKGIMLKSRKTPDGYYVNENGEWDGE